MKNIISFFLLFILGTNLSFGGDCDVSLDDLIENDKVTDLLDRVRYGIEQGIHFKYKDEQLIWENDRNELDDFFNETKKNMMISIRMRLKNLNQSLTAF